MSHENLLTGYKTSEILRDLSQETEGLERIAEQAGEDLFHETGSIPVVRKQEQHPKWQHDLGEDYDPLTSKIALVEAQVHRDFPDFRQNTVSARRSEWSLANTTTGPTPTVQPETEEHHVGWSLLGMRSMQGYREMRPPETEVEFLPTTDGELATPEGPKSFDSFSQQLRKEIEDLGDFDFHSVKLPAQTATKAPQELEAKAAKEADASEQDHPTLNMEIPRPPITVKTLGEAFPPPRPSGNATIERLAREASLAQTEQHISVGPESLEHVAAPVIPEFNTADEGATSEPATSEHNASDEALKALLAAPIREAVEPTPAKAALSASYERQVDALQEQVADTYDIHPLEVSLRGLERSVGDFLNRHKKAARIAEYAGAAVIAAAAGSRLLRRLRGRR